MANKFYIADMHFGHANIIGLDNRPFETVKEMDETMITNWNKVVQSGDIVYVLGDFLWKPKSVDIIKRLNGQKVLVKGNHDRVRSREYKECFVKIVDYEETKDGEHKLVLSHYPIIAYNGSFRGRKIHLYGHVHETNEAKMINEFIDKNRSEDSPFKMYNVGAMLPWMGYTPRTLDEILGSCEVG